MGSLSNLYISQSYQSLAHLGTNTSLVPGTMTQLQDGIGQSLNISFDGTNISSSGNIYAANITGSGATINTGSLVTTSSFNSYTQSTNVRLTNIESTTASLNSSVTQLNASSASQQVSINALNQFTASQSTASIVTSIDNLNTFTASANIRLNNLETNSASVNISISNLNSTTASQATSISNLNTSASLALITASLSGQTLTFTKGDNSTFGIILPDVSGSDITALNQFTASQLLINTGYNTFTSSTNTSISALNQFTASQSTASLVTSITELNTFSASAKISISALNSATSSYVTETESGSFLITASFDNNNRNLTFTKGDNTTFNVNIPDVSGSAGDFVTTASFNAYTQSNDQKVNSLEVNSASVNVSISNLNQFSQSAQISINSLNGATSSYANSASVALVDANQQSQINSLIAATGSYLTASADITALNAFTASQLNINTGYNTFTQSANQRLNSIESVSGSWITESETASFARTNIDNNFTANQTFTNITAVSASFTYVQTTYETASVIYSSGSNQFGDELSDIQTLSGSVKVQGSLTVNGTPVLTSSVDISGLVTTASFNQYTQSNNQRVSSLESNSASVNTSISALNQFTASQSTASLVTSIDNLNQFSASTLVSLSNLNSTTQSLNTSVSNLNQATSSLFVSASLALVTASASGNTITFTKGNTSTFSVTVDTGSAETTIFEVVFTGENITKGDPLYISGSQGANPKVFKADAADPLKMPVTFVSNETIGVNNTTNAIVLGLIEGIDLTGYTAGQSIYVAEGGGWSASLPSGSNSVTQLLGVVTKGGSGGKGLVLNPGPAQLPGLDNGYMWVGNGNNQPIEITTASFVNTASFNSYTSSTDSRLTNIESTTASLLIETQNLELFSASALISINSLNGFTSSQNILNGTFATTGSNAFFGTNTFSGAVSFTGSAPSILSQSFSGSLITNLTDTYTSVPSVQQIVTLTSASYAALLSGSLTNPNTLYIVSGSTDLQSYVTNTTFNSYTSSTNSRLNNIETTTASLLIETQNLELFSASALVSISNLNASSASQQVSIDALNVFTASQSTASLVTSIDNLNQFSASALTSINALNGATASYVTETESGSFLITASFSGNTLTFTKGDNSTFGVVIPDVSGSTFDTGSLVTTASFNAYTQSNDQKVNSLISATGSFATTGSNTFTGNQTISGSNYIQFGGSGANRIYQSGRLTIDGDGGAQLRNANSGEIFIEQYANAQLLIYNRANNEIQISGSATKIQDVDFIPFSASLNTRINNTGSYATTGSNSFNGSQTITGSITTTQDITISGVKFGFGNPAGTSSIAIGNTNTLENNTDDNNIAIGNAALQYNTTGERNIGIGTEALKNITGNSSYNTAIGGYALSSATSSTNTFALGYASMELAETGTDNVAIGVAALYRKKANSNTNTAIGTNALREHYDGDTNGGKNMAFGYDAMRNVTSGSANTAIGEAALRDAPRANENVFIGWTSGINAGHVDYNTVIGARAAVGIKNNYNTIIGHQAANQITSGSSNTIIGQNAATNISSGSSNTIIGQAAGAEVRGGSGNTFIGHTSGYNTSGSNNTFIGPYQGKGDESGVIALSDGSQNLRAIYNSGWVFTGSVDIQNTLTASLAQGFTYVGDANGRTTLVATSSFGSTLPSGLLSSSVTNFVDYSASVDTRINNIVTGTGFATTGSNTFTGTQNVSGSIVINSANDSDIFKIYRNGAPTQNWEFGITTVGNSFLKTRNRTWVQNDGPDGELMQHFLPTRFVNGIYAQDGPLDITGSVNISANLTASLQEGYVWVGNSAGRTVTVATSSFGGGGGTTYINPTLNPYSGSLILVGNTFTSSSFAHISASANGQVNLVFKNNNSTGDTILSGSNNLFVNPSIPTSGFKRYIGGSGNVMLNASNVPLISGSMTFSPTMNNNMFAANLNTMTMRGPVSSSAWTISANSFLGSALIGQTAANHAQGLVSGFTMTGNYQNGVLTIIANKANLTQATSLTNNNIGGTLTLTPASSSIVWQGNTSQGSTTVTNEVSGSGATVVSGSNSLFVSQNLIAGTATINASGAGLSDDPTGQYFNRAFERNLIGGFSNIVRLNGETTGSHSLSATGIIGNNLIVTGSSASTTLGSGIVNFGSAFFGRYNAQDGNRAKSAETIFAVGTGTSTTRKTGFLIDSGSNTFIEGTLNVSGSTTITGSLILSSSAAVELQVIGGSEFTGSVGISQTLQLGQLDPLPTGADGQLAVSASNLYFYSGSAWNKIAFG